MTDDLVQMTAAFLTATSLTLVVFLLLEGRKNRMDRRLSQLSGRGGDDADVMAQLTRSTLPRMGQALAPSSEEDRSRLRTRLIRAGLYGRQAMYVYLGVKLLLMVGPPLLGLAVGVFGLTTVSRGVVFGALGGIVGMIAPSFWLDRRKARRQRAFRVALPDAMDVLVICLEGGLSLSGALKRVADELNTAHPLLARELRIVEREVQMGRTVGEAVRGFGDRSDLEEVRNLASVISQTERFGAGLTRALRVHAESLREKRMRHAEEMAQKAATKILFPTLLCIFPGVFIVVLGPAVLQIKDWIGRLGG